MLNLASKQGITEIVSQLDDNTVLSLATTTTQGLLKKHISNREDAITAILNHTPSALSFLRRKIITREVLLSYLHTKNIPVELPCTKQDLIKKTSEVWEFQYSEPPPYTPDNTADPTTINHLAEQFVRWFYGLINQNEVMDPSHFFPDSILQINTANEGSFTRETICGAQEIVQKLFLIRRNFNLIFNPNLSNNGVRGRVDPHGLVLVSVCGTLHHQQGGTCVGVFEQMFGLVRDPLLENNWKVRNCELNLRSESGVTGPPTLEDCEMLAIT